MTTKNRLSLILVVMSLIFIGETCSITLKLSNEPLQETTSKDIIQSPSNKADTVIVQPTGTVLLRFGSFCSKKTKRCVGYCKDNKGLSMDDDTLDSFFCYVSKEIAGENIDCKNDDDCMDERFKAIGKHCSSAQVCKAVKINRM